MLSVVAHVYNSMYSGTQQKNNSRKYANNWRLNDQQVIAEITENIKSFLEVNENQNTTY
jgi:hypothetical protein